MQAEQLIIANITIFISRPSIFFPRYSGVRPSMNPSMNTATSAISSITVKPGSRPSEDYLSGLHVEQLNQPAERRIAIVHAVDRSVSREVSFSSGSKSGDTQVRSCSKTLAM
jgi:hypothetical protein